MAAKARQPLDLPPSQQPDLRLVTNTGDGPVSLKIDEFGDIELLALVNDTADPDGWVTTEEMALVTGIDAKNALHCVGSRFAYLRRIGAMEKDLETTKRWRLSPIGKAMVKGTLNAREARMLENLTDDKLLSLARGVTTRYRTTGATGAQLMRREWQYGTSKKRFR